MQWVWIPLVYWVYPWGAAGNRAYGHFDFFLFVGPLFFTAALPGLFRHYSTRIRKPQRVGQFIALVGSILLVVGSFGYAYGHWLIGVGFPSPTILLPLLIMSAGFVVLSNNLLRAGVWARWDGVVPITVASVPLLWLVTLLFVAAFFGSRMPDKMPTSFFEASFTALIILSGVTWILQGIALRSASLVSNV